jgi:hypothetical protein
MHMRAITITVFLCCAAGTSVQAETEVSACVGKLPADGQLIFNTVRPKLGATIDLRTLVRDSTLQLVSEGKVGYGAAPDAALAAAACLDLLRK